MLRVEERKRMIKIRYLVINAYSSYNMIIGQPNFNIVWASLYTLYLCMKYLLLNGGVEVI